MCHDMLGLNLVCMEYVIHSILLSPHHQKKKKGVGGGIERGAGSFTLLLL